MYDQVTHHKSIRRLNKRARSRRVGKRISAKTGKTMIWETRTISMRKPLTNKWLRSPLCVRRSHCHIASPVREILRNTNIDITSKANFAMGRTNDSNLINNKASARIYILCCCCFANPPWFIQLRRDRPLPVN